MFLNSIRNTLRTRVIGGQPANLTEANIRYLYLEILYAAILGAIATYYGLYAVRLGADSQLLAILQAAPALIAMVTSIPAARFLETRTHHKAWLFGSLLFNRGGHILLVLMPIIAPYNTAFWLVAWVIVLTTPGAFFANGFNAMLAEIIPERRRAFVFSRRTIIYSLATVVVLAVAGRWLDSVPFPLNYQLMFLFGTITVMGSQYYLMRLSVPDHAVRVPTIDAPRVKAELTRPMRKMLLNMFVYQLGLQISAPLFVLYYANTLHVSDGLISINGAAGTLGVVVGLALWEAVMRTRSFGWVLRTATLGTWIFPFTVGLTFSFPLIIAANFVVNILHPAVDLSSLNVMLKLSKPEQRNLIMSYYTTAVSTSAFIAPLAAVPLAGRIGIPGVMLIAAALRLSGGVLFQLNRVNES